MKFSPHLSAEKKESEQTRKTAPTIVVLLYMYPLTEETYAPLHASIRSHPGLRFLIILNPNSGPGAPPWWPDGRYVHEIPRLNTYPNVCTLGYVRIDYCKRPQTEILHDIRAYGLWSADEANPGTFVHGIFFDETPNHYSQLAAKTLQEINREVQVAVGIRGPRIIMHNPGTPPDERLTAAARPNITAVCEESFNRYRSLSRDQKANLQAQAREECCMIMHTVPQRQIPVLTEELSSHAGYLFITELGPGACYQEWGPGWDKFVNAVARLKT